MPWDKLGLAYAPITELDVATTVSALDWIPFHNLSLDKVSRVTAADLGVAPLIATDLATDVVTSGTESWYNVTGSGVTITLNTDPDDGDLVRVSLDEVNSAAIIGTANGVTNPVLLGAGNNFNIAFALTASEWKFV